jgi:hydrogenase maturation factor
MLGVTITDTTATTASTISSSKNENPPDFFMVTKLQMTPKTGSAITNQN